MLGCYYGTFKQSIKLPRTAKFLFTRIIAVKEKTFETWTNTESKVGLTF
jgi:hypothetical protein